MKKLFSVLLALSMLLVGAMAMAESETVMIQSLNGAGEEIELTVPANPKRIAILDMASLDILNSLGVSDRVVGSATTKLPFGRISSMPRTWQILARSRKLIWKLSWRASRMLSLLAVVFPRTMMH